MQSQTIELMSGYQAYADASDLNVGAASDAPATTIPCTIYYSYVSSNACASMISVSVTIIVK